MKRIKFEGRVSLRPWNNTKVVYLSDDEEEALPDRLEEISEKRVSVRYWVAEKQATAAEITEEFAKTLSGRVNLKFGAVYNELSGHLWTDNELMVGGHDLLNELSSYNGKWLVLEIDIYEENEGDVRV